jgi:hypothetical protein
MLPTAAWIRLFGFVGCISYQAYPGKEKYKPDDANYRKRSGVAGMVYNTYAGIN